MKSSFFKQAAEFLQERKNAKKWLAVFLCLAVVVTTGTLAALKLNGHAMTQTTRELVCSYEVHKHTKDCYKEVDGEKQLVCGYADYVVHTHNDDCYDEDGKLICQLPEIKEHKHTDDCYKQEKVLVCGKEEAEAHEHTDDCYKVEKELTCGKEESEEHTHSDDCYTEEKTLVCEKEETKGHEHTDDCYKVEKVLACGELELHTHTDECYETLKGVDEDGDGKDDQKLICEIPVLEEHVHTADCFREVEVSDEADAANEEAEDSGKEVYLQEEEPTDVSEGNEGSETTPAAVTEKTEYQLKDDFSYELDDYQLTLHVDGVAVAETVQAEGEQADQGQGEAEVKPEAEVSEESGDASETEKANEPEVKQEIADAADGDNADAGETQQEEKSKETQNVDETDEAKETSEADEAKETDADSETEENAEEKDLPVLTAADVEFTVEQIGEDSDIYAAFEAAMNSDTEETDQEEQESEENDNALQLLSVLNLGFRLNGVDLDVSNCKITAEVTPKEAAFDAVEVANANDTENKTETEAKAEEETEPSLTLTAMQLNGNEANSEVETLSSATVAKSEIKPMSFSLINNQNNYMAIALGDPMDIEFHVQYYAYLSELVKVNQVDDKQEGYVKIIDTAGNADGTGGNLPQNKTPQSLKALEVEKTGEEFYPDYSWPEWNSNGDKTTLYSGTFKISEKEKVLKEIFNFDDEQFIFRDRPGMEYIKMLPGEYGDHYDLCEVWVLKPDKKEDSTDRNDWDIYDDPNAVEITNAASAEGVEGKKAIVVKDDTVIRLVYKPNTGEEVVYPLFHDYDISDGVKKDTRNTGFQGINSLNNLNTQTKYTFGNSYGPAGNLTGNWANLDNWGLCTFKLVQEYMSGGTPQFQSSLPGPQIFGDTGDKVTGKKTYDNYTLNFSRKGDTYTLVSVNNTTTGKLAAEHLDRMWCLNSGRYKTIYCNNFWPMDDVEGADGKAGGSTKFGFSTKGGSAYASDNGIDHNNYFGMQYQITFDYDEHYRGPLEYLFFGDDDMWVFLDGRLILDLGGVHPAVGEYVNLWDWLTPEQAGKHTLSVFFTERGASGSTCYTQFTLPSMETIPATASLGGLEISKEVEGTAEKDTEYSFELALESDNTYGYDIKNEDGTVESSGEITRSGSFKLKAGQKLVIDNSIPLGTKYTITENLMTGFVPTVTVDGQKKELNNGKISGTIGKLTSSVQVAYTNHVTFALPETGGIGTTKTYALGVLIALVAISALMYTTKKRRKEGN